MWYIVEVQPKSFVPVAILEQRIKETVFVNILAVFKAKKLLV
jgi:hypothetical protein